MSARYLVAASLICLIPPVASAQISSNAKVVAPFKSIVAAANESTVRVRSGTKDIALGTIVYSDGYILTKASELRGDLTIRFSDGGEYEATIVGRHKETDLALLHVDGVKDLKAVSFGDSAKVPVGNWLVAASANSDPVGVGIVSVMVRKLTGQDLEIINHNKGYLGIKLDSPDPKDEDGKILGAKIIEVTKDGAASKAGLKEKDVIVSIDGKPVLGRAALQEFLENYRPGEDVKVGVLRDGEDMTLKAKLSGERIVNQATRGDMQNSMGSELSGRRTGFPAVLQTDMVIEPRNCGGPIVDLNGKVLGISIARAGRVETWILPSENIKPILADLKSGKYAPANSATKSEK